MSVGLDEPYTTAGGFFKDVLTGIGDAAKKGADAYFTERAARNLEESRPERSLPRTPAPTATGSPSAQPSGVFGMAPDQLLKWSALLLAVGAGAMLVSNHLGR